MKFYPIVPEICRGQVHGLRKERITPQSFMKFCPIVPEICRGQVHGPRKERRRRKRKRIIIIIIIRNGAKTILCLGDLN